jgi:hypothetical protein
MVYDYFKKKNATKTTISTQPQSIVIYNILNDDLLKIAEQSNKRILDLESQLEVTLFADSSVNYGQLVCINNGHCTVYDPMNPDLNDLPIGFSKQYGYAGAQVKIQISGVFSGLSGLELNTKYYAGESGTITKVAPTSGMLRSVGYTNELGSLIIDFSQKIVL